MYAYSLYQGLLTGSVTSTVTGGSLNWSGTIGVGAGDQILLFTNSTTACTLGAENLGLATDNTSLTVTQVP